MKIWPKKTNNLQLCRREVAGKVSGFVKVALQIVFSYQFNNKHKGQKLLSLG